VKSHKFSFCVIESSYDINTLIRFIIPNIVVGLVDRCLTSSDARVQVLVTVIFKIDIDQNYAVKIF
jgi:hypothetical protein